MEFEWDEAKHARTLRERGIGFDDRFAAAVCDGGIWDLHERAFLIDRDAELEAGAVRQLGLARVARNIQCPVLISTGERGWLKAERVRELYDHLRTDGRDVTLKIFTSGETAAAQGHADNPTLANEYIFDWMAARLGIEPVRELVLDAVRLVQERQRADRGGHPRRQARRVPRGLALDTDEREALLLGLDGADRLAVDEEEVVDVVPARLVAYGDPACGLEVQVIA